MPRKLKSGELGLPAADDRALVSIDPGDVHCGVAVWYEHEIGWACVWAGELTPAGMQDWLIRMIHVERIRTLVVESFALYGDKALAQTGSKMETPQMIGYIRGLVDFFAEIHGIEVELVFQTPADKKPAFKIAKGRGYTLQADRMKVPDDHAKDAEIHGYRHITKTLGQTVRECEPRLELPGFWLLPEEEK